MFQQAAVAKTTKAGLHVSIRATSIRLLLQPCQHIAGQGREGACFIFLDSRKRYRLTLHTSEMCCAFHTSALRI